MEINSEKFNIGCWSADVLSGAVSIDSGIAMFMGVGVSELSYYQVLKLVDSQDRRSVKEVADALRESVPKSCSFGVKKSGNRFLTQITVDSVDGSRVGGFMKVERLCEAQDNQRTETYARMGVYDCRLLIEEKRIELTLSNKQMMSFEEFLKYVHRDDVREVGRVFGSLQEKQVTDEVICVKFRSKILTDSDRWYELRVDYVAKSELHAVLLDAQRRTNEFVEQATPVGDAVADILHKERIIKELTLVMEAVLTYTPVCIFIKDPNNDFRYLYWNKAMADAVGVSTKDAIGKTDAEIFVDVMDVDHFREDDVKLLQGGVTTEFEESFINAQGELRTTFTLKALIPTEYEYPWIMGVAIDISSKKQQEMELIKAKEKAEESDRFKSSFLANMSHEIRTPLNSIVGFSELLGDTGIDKEDRDEYLEIIKKNNQLLLQLVSDILDLSRIESRVMDLTFNKIDVNLMCGRIAKSSALIKEAKVPIVVKNGMPQFYVCSDENRTQQVITNFVTNALKFTNQGSIEIGANLLNDNELEIYVQDTGTGIDQQKLGSVFERFVKLNKNVQGTGLGLSICRNLVELMGGRIGVESKVGVGSKFWFTLPVYRD